MAGKEVKNRITLDSSKFERGGAAVVRMSKRMQRNLGAGMRSAARLGGKGLALTGVAAAGMVAGIGAGVKSVVNLGADLDHLKTQTGVAVAELVVLRQVMEDNGVSAESARKAINRMQKQIVDAGDGLSTPLRALERIGLSFEDLDGRGPGEQFRMIAKAISTTEDPAVRAASAMDLFGRAGAEMQGVFGANFEEAAASLGEQAKILEKNSVLFERVGTLLDRTGNKLQGFFVGIADKVVPLILPLLERFDKLDLADEGQRFGQGIASGIRLAVGIFENNSLGKMTQESMIIAGKGFINTIARGWSGLILGVGKAWLNGWKKIFTFKRQAFQGLGSGLIGTLLVGFQSVIAFAKEGFLGIAASFSGAILTRIGEAIAKIPLPKMDEIGASITNTGAALTASGDERRGNAAAVIDQFQADAGAAWNPLTETLRKLPSKFGMALLDGFADGMLALEGINILDTKANRDRLKDLLSAARDAGDAVVPPESSSAPAPAGSPVITEERPSPFAAMGGRPLTGGVSSLASIGGGGGVSAASGVEAALQTGNRLLAEINDGIRGMRNQMRGIGNERGGFGRDPVLI